MTNEEAIEILKRELEPVDKKVFPEVQQALDMAIQALEQEHILDNIKADIKNWYWQADKQILAKDPCVVDAMVDLFIRTINKYKESEEEE